MNNFSSSFVMHGKHIYHAFTSHPLSYFIHLPMKMELIEGSETSAINIVTPGNYPKENILQPLVCLQPH